MASIDALPNDADSSPPPKVGRWSAISRWLVAIVLGLVLTAILMLAVGVNPIGAYVGMIDGAFGTPTHFSDTLLKTIPVVLIALGAALTFRAGLWNVGGEGQFLFGGIAAAVIGIKFEGPAFVIVAAEIVGGVAAGALAGLIPAVLKVRYGSNEILVTLMLNFIGLLLAGYVISGPLSALHTAASLPIHESGRLPWFSPFNVRVHIGIVFAILAIMSMHILMRHTTFGYGVRAMGINDDAARNVGVNITRTSVLSFVFAGGLAGLAGTIQVVAVHYGLVDGFSLGLGFAAIVAALLGGMRAIGTALAAFCLSALFVGGQAMQRSEGIPVSLVFVIQGGILLLLLGLVVTERYSERTTSA